MKNETTNDAVMSAVIYCRVSTKEQVEEGNSLVSQERLCREYALKEGYQIAEVFIERGESAKTADRKELQRMLSFCETRKNGVNALIAYKVDRISRNIADYSHIKVRLKKHGITVKSVTEFFEDTPAGRFMENIISNVSQFDNEMRTERSVGGMQEAVQEGRYVWKAPLGYDNVRIDGKATISPNGVAALVAEAFELVAQRTYATEVVRLLMHEKGLSNKFGKAINRSYFFRLLRNPLYKGVLTQFGKVSVGTYKPLVSEDTFDTVQAVLKGRKNKVKHYLKEHPDFPLRRFVLSEGGLQLTGYWSKGKRKKYPYYTFGQPGTVVRKEVLEQKFMEFLRQYTFELAHLNLLKQFLEKHFGKKLENDKLANMAIEKRLQEIDKQIDSLIALHGQVTISEGTFVSRIKKLEAEQEELQDLLRSKTGDNTNFPDLLVHVTKFLEEPHLYWQKSPLEIKRKLQVFDFPNGVIFDGVNFRTLKVCSIYKLKELFDEQKFSIVNLRDAGKNTTMKTNTPHSRVSLLETKAFGCKVANDLKILEGLTDQTAEQHSTKKLS